MVILKRSAETIHREEGGWFQARWHFSFDHYRDPENMGIGPLRVFNDDTLVPGAIWPLHPHRDVEGLTYVVEGRFRHEDDQGNNGEFPAGSAQRMTLGRGAWHSEQNASKDEPVRFIQMWILPHTPALEPSCEQRIFRPEHRLNRFLHIFCPDTLLDAYTKAAERSGVPGPIPVHGAASVAVSTLEPGIAQSLKLTGGGSQDDGIAGYVYVIEGEIDLDGSVKLSSGDAAKLFDVQTVQISALRHSHLVVVDVPQRYRPVGIWAAAALRS